ncbi:hypothetical protein A1351_15000 [Methylosinus sp. R-45379]|nr:hypothetical protein A1351_15000 [Methylosinus sp. R-45379]
MICLLQARPSKTRPETITMHIVSRAARRALASTALSLAFLAHAQAQELLPTIDIGATARRPAGADDPRSARSGDRVTGYAAASAASAKLDAPILDTPIAVQVVTRQTMDDRQAISINDAVVGTVSSTSLMPTGCTLFQNLIIRGFPTGNLQLSQSYRNGLLLPAQKCPSTANVQSIEVVKGPVAMLYGRVEPGGLVDTIIKRPLETPYYSVQQQGSSFGGARTTIDATGPITPDKVWLYRVTAEFNHNPSFIDYVTDDRWFGSATVTYHPSEHFKLNVDAEYTDVKGVDNNPNIPAIGYNAAPIPISRYLGDPSITVDNPSHDMRRQVAFDWTYDLDQDWSVTNRFLYSNSRAIQTSFFLVCVNQPGQLNNTPAAWCPSSGPVGQSNVSLNWGPVTYRTITGNLDVKGRFDTGFLHHSVLIGTDHMSYSQVGDIYQSNQAQSLNIYAPNYYNASIAPYSGLGISRFITPANGTAFIRAQEWQGLYAQDMISFFDDRVHLLLGGRYDFASAVSSGQSSTSALLNNALMRANYLAVRVADHAFSPRVGLSVQALPWLAFYGNYTESFGVNNGVTRNNTPLGPQRAIQWEGGMKAELFDKRLIATAAYYVIDKHNIAQATPSAPTALRNYVFDLLDARSEGVELDVSGRIDDNWSVIANFSHMSTHVTRGSTPSATDPFDVTTQAPIAGKRLPAVPDNMGNVWVKYEADGYLRGLSGAIGVSRVGNAFVDPANTYLAPAYTNLNAMASYRFQLGGSFVTAQINADNLTNSTYYYGTSQFPGRFAGSPGAPRSVIGSLRVEY